MSQRAMKLFKRDERKARHDALIASLAQDEVWQLSPSNRFFHRPTGMMWFTGYRK